MNDAVRDKFTALQAAWTSYTPVLTGSTTNPTLGTGGVIFGKYMQVGKTISVFGAYKFGTSGFTTGSGTYNISLPVTGLTQSQTVMGSAVGSPNGSIFFVGWAQVFTTVATIYMPTSPSVCNTVAISNSGIGGTAWAAGGIVRWNFNYEAA
jgi:hypothetical protein